MKQELLEINQSGEVLIRDGSGSLIQLTKVGGLNVTAGSASLGGFQKQLTFSPTGTPMSTSAVFADVLGMVNQQFTTPANGQHTFTFNNDTFVSAVGTNIQFQLVIDETIFVPIGGTKIHNASSTHSYQTGTAIVNLTAGTHTIRPQWKMVAGTGPMDTDQPWTLLIQAQGSGINGLEVIESTLTNDVRICATFPLWEASGLIVTFNTLENEEVGISYTGNGFSVGTDNFLVGYRIDGGTVIPATFNTVPLSWWFTLNFSTMSGPLSAGTHTVELMGARNGPNSNNYDIVGTSLGQSKSALQVTRFKSVGTGAGTIVTESTLGAFFDFNLASYVDTGMTTTFTTAVANEQVSINYNGGATLFSATNNSSAFLALQVDGGTDSPSMAVSELATNTGFVSDASFNKIITIVTPGSHTVKLRAKTNDPLSTFRLNVSADESQTLQAIQYRGGLIPIQDEGVEAVAKPTAIDFVGAGVTVTATGTKATVTIPGGGGGSNETADNLFRVIGSLDVTKKMAFEVDGLTTATTRTITMPDKNLDLADINTIKATRQATAISATTNGSSIVGCTAAGITITLATADVVAGKVIYIKDESGLADAAANKITIDTQGAETIDGVASITIIVAYGAARLYSDGTNWFTL